MKRVFLNTAAYLAGKLPLPVRRSFYRFPFLAKLIRQSLNYAAPVGLQEIEIAAGPLTGWRMCLDLQAEKDYWLGTYEPDLQTAILDWVKPGMKTYDLGANVGYVSLLMAKQVGLEGQVTSFEPLPANIARFQQNLALNQSRVRVTLVQAAVVEADRLVTFLTGRSAAMGKVAGVPGRDQAAYAAEVQVTGVALDTYLAEVGGQPPDVIKIDIEGGEVLALPGMRGLLRNSPPLIFLELHGPEAARTAWEELSAAGYQICRMQPGYPRVEAVEELNWKAYLVALPPNRRRDERI
jgi:FkbM family methyltransferase